MADPGYPLEPDLPQEEYQLRLRRARARMELEGLDALDVTSSTGQVVHRSVRAERVA